MAYNPKQPLSKNNSERKLFDIHTYLRTTHYVSIKFSHQSPN